MPTSRAVLRSSLAALTLAVPLAWGAVARAQAACGDQTCPKNYECTTVPAACPEIACADGTDCAPCSGTSQYCAPLSCATDADCADDMVCYKQTQQNCPTAPPCANGEKCAEPADTTCTTETVSACVPRYLTPCQADADCGVGFTCEEEQECSCSGSVGSAGSGSASAGSASGSGGGDASSDGGAPTPAAPAPADGGSADPVPPEGSAPSADGGTPTPPDCTCAPSGTKACNLKIVACSVDQGCPSGWTCGDNPHRVCSSSSDGTTSCSGDPAKVCLPPYADLSLGGSGHDIGLDAPGRGETSGSAGTGGGNTTTSPPSSNPESPGTAQDGSKAATSPSSSTTESDSGCAVGEPRGAASGTFGFLALAFAGLVGLRRRRTN